MTTIALAETPDVQSFLNQIAGLDGEGGDARFKKVLRRVVLDVFKIIDDFDVSPDEFWKAVNYLNELGGAGEAGLLAAGLGMEQYLDRRMDAEDAAAGVAGGTPRTIEGPLYVAGAPLSTGFARLDDGSDTGTVLFMSGTVRDTDGKPLEGAIVDVWHANTKGMYSYFDSSQSDYNLRRRVETGPDGRYEFRTIVPVGYGCPPEGPTQGLLNGLGRHGNRPAHIHFFVTAPDHRKLTTQINIEGDAYLHDDFAYATRDDLIPPVTTHEDPAEIHAKGLNAPFASIDFDFTLVHRDAAVPDLEVTRKRALAA